MVTQVPLPQSIPPPPPKPTKRKQIRYIREYIDVNVGVEENVANTTHYSQQQAETLQERAQVVQEELKLAAAESQQNLSLQTIQNVEYYERQEQQLFQTRIQVAEAALSTEYAIHICNNDERVANDMWRFQKELRKGEARYLENLQQETQGCANNLREEVATVRQQAAALREEDNNHMTSSVQT